jgi:predicted esterase
MQHEATFTTRARYQKLGTITPQTQHVWFVLHGYGQLAQYFIRKFRPLEDAGICVIAPEALSRFYLEDVTSRMQSGNNRVGASWMTRENRQMDIDNYIHYLDAVYRQEIPPAHPLRVTILGFSQGAATATRWAVHGQVPFHRLILWAGIFPPDMDLETGREVLKDKEVVVVYGTADPYLTDERFAELETLSARLHITPKQVTFEGAHDIHEATLPQLF